MIKTPVDVYSCCEHTDCIICSDGSNADLDEVVSIINVHYDLIDELKQVKQFLEDMHMMPIDWTIKESQHRHLAVVNILERCK